MRDANGRITSMPLSDLYTTFINPINAPISNTSVANSIPILV